MKVQFRITLILFGLILITSSCKRNEGCTNVAAKNYCPHCKKDNGTCSLKKNCTRIFWFDKATSDSLIAHGYTKLYCFYTGTTPENGPQHLSVISTDRFFTSAPICDGENLLKFTWPLYDGESITASVTIADSISFVRFNSAAYGPTNPYPIPLPFKNWTGTFNFIPDKCDATQLIWNN